MRVLGLKGALASSKPYALDAVFIGVIAALFAAATVIVFREPLRLAPTLFIGVAGLMAAFVLLRDLSISVYRFFFGLILVGAFTLLGSFFIAIPGERYAVFETVQGVRLEQGPAVAFFLPIRNNRMVPLPGKMLESFSAGLPLGGEKRIEWKIFAVLELTADYDAVFSHVARLGGGEAYLAEVREMLTHGVSDALKQKFDAANPEQKYASGFSVELPADYVDALGKLGYKVVDIAASDPRMVLGSD